MERFSKGERVVVLAIGWNKIEKPGTVLCDEVANIVHVRLDTGEQYIYHPHDLKRTPTNKPRYTDERQVPGYEDCNCDDLAHFACEKHRS